MIFAFKSKKKKFESQLDNESGERGEGDQYGFSKKIFDSQLDSDMCHFFLYADRVNFLSHCALI